MSKPQAFASVIFFCMTLSPTPSSPVTASAQAASAAEPDGAVASVFELVLDEGHDGVQHFGHYRSAALAQAALERVKQALDEAHPADDEGWARSSQLCITELRVLDAVPELQRHVAMVDLLTGAYEVHPAPRVSIAATRTPWHVLDAPGRFLWHGTVPRAAASGPTPQSALHRARLEFERARAAGVQPYLETARRILQAHEQEEPARGSGSWLDVTAHERLKHRMREAFGEDADASEIVLFASRRFGL